MSLADLIKNRSSSASLEKPSESPAVAGGESGSDQRPAPELAPGETRDLDDRVPGDNQQEGFSSEELLAQASTPGGIATDHGGSPLDSSSPDPEGEPASEEAALVPEVAPSGDEPYGVAEQEHPSGICVYFQAGPKRLYRLRGKADTPSGVVYTDWKEVPSVSEILDVLEKGGLPWWGMKVGVQGVLELQSMGALWRGITVDEIVGNKDLGIKGLLTQHRLTVNHVRDQAGDRGTNVHTALELWADKGIMPQPDVYPPEEKGYIAALRDFLIDSGAEPVRSEVMVGSAKHKFAGRYDVELAIPNGAEVVTRSFPKNPSIRSKLPGGVYLNDLKTSKEVYDTHFIQLEAYEGGRLECGLEPTLLRGVIHVTADGRYELKLNIQHHGNVAGPDKWQPKFDGGKPLVTFTDFKHVMGAAKALERIKSRK